MKTQHLQDLHQIPSDALLSLILFQILDIGLVLAKLLLELLNLFGATAVTVAGTSFTTSLKLSVDVTSDSGNVALDDAFKFDLAL